MKIIVILADLMSREEEIYHQAANVTTNSMTMVKDVFNVLILAKPA